MDMKGFICSLAFVWTLFAMPSETVAGEFHPFAKAEGVWGEGCSATNAYLRFRTVFTAKKGDKPVLRVTASTVYRATANGSYVGYGPARSAEGTFKVDEWPLPDVREGENELVIDVAGYANVSFQYVIQPGFLQAEVVCDDRILAATPADFTATEIMRDRGGPVYSKQRGFPSERYTVDSASTPPPIGLTKGPLVRYLPRGVPYPEFNIKRFYSETNTGVSTVWQAPVNDSGFLGFKVRVTEPGVFEARFEEALTEGRVDAFRNGDPAKSWHGTRNVLSWDVKQPGDYVFETFEPYTFRYVEARMASGKAEISAPYLRQFRNPYPERASFVSSDPDVDGIFLAACDTLAQNGVDVYTDCPGRERLSWLCDSWFSAQAGAYLTGDFSVERAGLEIFARAPRFRGRVPEGGLPGSYPGLDVMPYYTIWYVIQCGAYFHRENPPDAKAFADLVRARVLKVLEFLSSFENADGLVENPTGDKFLDQSQARVLTQYVSFVGNMLWAKALQCAGEMYGRKDLLDKADKVRATIRRLSYDGRYFHDQMVNGVRVEQFSEACQYFAFFSDAATKDAYPELWHRLLADFGPGRAPENVFPVDMFVGRLLRLGLLSSCGQKAMTLSEMKTSLLNQVRTSGTFWEFADGHDSRCHGFASYVALLLVRDVIGLSIDHARRSVTVADTDIPIDFGTVRLPVRDGTVELSFRHEAGRIERKLKMPVGWRQNDSKMGSYGE